MVRTTVLAGAMLAAGMLLSLSSSDVVDWPDEGTFWTNTASAVVGADLHVSLMRVSVVSAGFHNGCCVTPTWCRTSTRVVCSVHSATVRTCIGPFVHMLRCSQTATYETNNDGDVHAWQPWPEIPLRTTYDLSYGCLPTPIARSWVLHRCPRRHARTQVHNDDEATSWWVNISASVVGFVIVVLASDTVSMWATLSTIIGLYWLATNRHFDRHVCVLLSLNFWVATAWVVLMVSLESGVLLTSVAIALRSSVLLFPQGEGQPKLAVCCFDNGRPENS